MRTTIAFGVTLALVTAACDGGRAVGGNPADAGTPQFSVNANTSRVVVFNDRFTSEDESFPLCDGGVAFGDIEWHEVVLHIPGPDGTSRVFAHLNMVEGGRATGPDGTEYVVQQVNGEFVSGWPPQHPSTVRIMLLSPGSADNLFYTLQRDASGSTVTVECRG